MSVRGRIAPRRLSVDAIAALKSGNVDELLRLSKVEFPGTMVMMAKSGDDDDDDDDADDNDNDDGDDSGDDDDDAGKKGSSKQGDDDDDEDDRLERIRKRMKAADKRATDAEKALKKVQDAEKGELKVAQDRVTELEKSTDELTVTVRDLRLQNAFLTANTATWHDPDVALTLAQSKHYLDDIVDEDNGEVDKKALGKALERLAKEHAYLVKTEEKKTDDDDGPSGESGGGRSDNLKDEKAKKQALKNRFPALNR